MAFEVASVDELCKHPPDLPLGDVDGVGDSCGSERLARSTLPFPGDRGSGLGPGLEYLSLTDDGEVLAQRSGVSEHDRARIATSESEGSLHDLVLAHVTEVLVGDFAVVAQLGPIALAVDFFARQGSEQLDGLIAVVLTAQQRGELVVGEVVRALEITVLLPGADDVIKARIILEDLRVQETNMPTEMQVIY